MVNLLRSTFRSFQSFTAIFQPPFNGLAWLVVLYYGWCFFVYPHSQTLRGNLPDPDDYMYLTQVLDWLNGQGWYDNIQHRLNPPEGVPIHFSRLTQMPIAALIWLIEKIGFGPRASAMITALIYPLFLLGGLMTALRWLAQSFMPQKWTGITAYVALFATAMMFMFMPGHIDHHNLVIVLVALTLGCVLRMAEKPADPLWSLVAGLLTTLNLTVALETLPWLLIISAWIGIWAATKGGKAAINALAYSLSLYLGSILCLIATRPPAQWLTPDVLTYSMAYVYLTGGIAVAFAAIALAAKAPVSVRWLTGALFALATGYMYLHRFPDLIAGPYGGMDPELAHIMLSEISEAQSLLHHHKEFLDLVIFLGSPVLALASGVYFFIRSKTDLDRWRWSLILTLLLAAMGLTIFYQYRFTGMMGLFGIVPLTVLLQRGWTHLSTLKPSRKKVFAEIGLLLLVGPLTGVIIPALIDGRSFNTGFFLFPVDASVKQTPCDTYRLERILTNPKTYGDHPRLIMGSLNEGPELLFRTPHQVLAAPFHMDVSGNVDADRFFSTPYASEAEAIAKRRHIDLVIACRYVPDRLTRTPSNAILENGSPTAAATTGTSEHDFAPHFIELIMTNKQPPWLKPIRFPELHNFVIFEMSPDATSGATQKSRKAN